jgi:raffinose/stachyose/melibiose transport system permease protein
MRNKSTAISIRSRVTIGKVLSYVIFISWTLLTVIPLFWMFYSSFKTNEELNTNSYSLPYAMLDNMNDVFVVIAPTLNLEYPFDPSVDTRPRLIIESTEMAPQRRLMVQFLLKEDLPPAIANLKPGDTVRVNQLPIRQRLTLCVATFWWNYTSAFTRGGLTLKFINSLVYTIVSTFLIVLLGLMISFGVTKLRFKKLSTFVVGAIGFGYLININSVIIPLFLMLTKVKLTDTHIGIILVYTAFGLPLAVMIASQFMKGLPDSLIESAYIDGATPFRTFLSIITPMTVPVIITVCIMSGLSIWNEFLLVLVFASSEATKSLPVGVFSFSSKTGTQMGWQLAALVIATLPVMIVYFLFQKRLAEGVAGGAVKG